MEIGRAGCDVSHAFYCFSWLLFQSPVTEALAMTLNVEQCSLTWANLKFTSKYNWLVKIM